MLSLRDANQINQMVRDARVELAKWQKALALTTGIAGFYQKRLSLQRPYRVILHSRNSPFGIEHALIWLCRDVDASLSREKRWVRQLGGTDEDLQSLEWESLQAQYALILQEISHLEKLIYTELDSIQSFIDRREWPYSVGSTRWEKASCGCLLKHWRFSHKSAEAVYEEAVDSDAEDCPEHEFFSHHIMHWQFGPWVWSGVPVTLYKKRIWTYSWTLSSGVWTFPNTF